MRRTRAARRKSTPSPGCEEEALGSGREGVAAPEVAMATEPEAAEPVVPSLVDRYFTRWYKPGKCRVMLIPPWPHWHNAVETTLTDRKPRALALALPPHVRRSGTSVFPLGPGSGICKDLVA